MLKIDETTNRNGQLSAVFLRMIDGVLQISEDDGAFALPEEALHAVVARFGAPFDVEARIHRVATLVLAPGHALHHVRHLAGYDVIARDYLVYESAGRESLCAPARTVAGALLHLGRAHAAKPSSQPSNTTSGPVASAETVESD